MPFPGSGAGTEGDPFLITSVSELTHCLNSGETETFYDANYFKLSNDINFTGETWTRVGSFAGFLNLNGFTINIDTFSVNGLASDGSGGIENGELNFNISQSSNVQPIIDTSGYFRNLIISGTLTSTGSWCYGVCRSTSAGADVSNIIVTANITGNSDNNSDQNRVGVVGLSSTGTVDKIIFTGTITNNGTGGVDVFEGTTTSNCFYDTDIAGVVNSSEGTGKTTNQLQDIDTYTDTGTTGLDEAYDMAAEASYNNELWVLQPSSYPSIASTVELVSSSIVQPVTITINSSS